MQTPKMFREPPKPIHYMILIAMIFIANISAMFIIKNIYANSDKEIRAIYEKADERILKNHEKYETE